MDVPLHKYWGHVPLSHGDRRPCLSYSSLTLVLGTALIYFNFNVNVCQNIDNINIEVEAGHHEMIHFAAQGRCIMYIEVTNNEQLSRC